MCIAILKPVSELFIAKITRLNLLSVFSDQMLYSQPILSSKLFCILRVFIILFQRSCFLEYLHVVWYFYETIKNNKKRFNVIFINLETLWDTSTTGIRSKFVLTVLKSPLTVVFIIQYNCVLFIWRGMHFLVSRQCCKITSITKRLTYTNAVKL